MQNLIKISRVNTGVYLMNSSHVTSNIRPVSLHGQPGKRVLHLIMEDTDNGEILWFSGTAGNMRRKEVIVSGSESNQKSGVSPQIIVGGNTIALEKLELIFS
ncbi:MAG: hypothetical protein OEV93_02115 [Candidatus Moranbacteria bacterium]|nr:hypothetical protein [Candidatus Moranbacteria bacterium]